MAEKKPNSVPRRIHEVRRTDTPSGVTHVRAHQPDRFTVVGNHLAQHPMLSLTAIGLAAHILSLPEGAPVDIRSLAERFPEGRDRIAFALRELETHGYLRRVRERTESGRIATRTYAHHLPVHVPAVPGPAAAPRARRPVSRPSRDAQTPPQEEDRGAGRAEPAPTGMTAVPSATPAPEAPVVAVSPPPSPARADQPDPPPAEATPHPRDDRAVALLAGLRRCDDRLTLSRRDVYRLAPAVTAWFDVGATAATVIHTLTAGLPTALESPAALIAYRLRNQIPLPLPEPTVLPARPATAPHPMRNCDGCDRGFRAPEPGRCRDCRAAPATMYAA
ncbi:helix-turn-helix domain-containing protein [Streptomyces griseoluteus]|uniref:Helix-turn-helix domain-containing protein n=1 Tax=Streptomyces griseoluteus TaxID=29306 RepID=A0A4Z1DNX4_STRGP|nr:helix-turn-helix domain-containing protein [Streptomyces griseoluteus]TGN86878.1 helix-turn-helix domain-containing protein [Streptomyces griseoluteus]GHF31856.1 DNA-binding protein [Streptomyces griseoluteus]